MRDEHERFVIIHRTSSMAPDCPRCLGGGGRRRARNIHDQRSTSLRRACAPRGGGAGRPRGAWPLPWCVRLLQRCPGHHLCLGIRLGRHRHLLAPITIEEIYPPAVATTLSTAFAYIGYITWMLFFYLFPSGRFVPRWTRWLALIYGVFFFGLWNFTSFGPESWPPSLFGAPVVAVWGSFPMAQVYRYAPVSGPVGRQKTKWGG